MNKVTENRRKGDDKALLAEVFKLLGNSSYGKLIEAKERQKTVIYTKDQSVVDKAKRSVWFEDMEEIDDVFELEFRKKKVTINRPFQDGIVVYQLASSITTALTTLSTGGISSSSKWTQTACTWGFHVKRSKNQSVRTF